MAQRNADRIELLLDRLGSLTKTFTEASERSTRRIDVQIKAYVDRGARATDQTLVVIDRELQRQIAAMKRELPRLERAAERIREAAPVALRPKDVPTRAATTTRPAVTKAPAKKAPPKKSPAKKTPAQAKKAPAGAA